MMRSWTSHEGHTLSLSVLAQCQIHNFGICMEFGKKTKVKTRRSFKIKLITWYYMISPFVSVRYYQSYLTLLILALPWPLLIWI